MGLSDDIDEIEPPEDDERLEAAPFLHLDDHVASARVAPDEPPYISGKVSLYVDGNDDLISVDVSGSREGTEVDTGFYIDPDGAEQLAEYLEEFAEKAREGTAWRYP